MFSSKAIHSIAFKMAVIILAMATPDIANAAFWVDESCGTNVVQQGRQFKIDLGRRTLTCTVEWRVANSAGTLNCNDGSKRPIRIVNKETIQLDGETMRTPSDRYQVCH